MIPIGSKLSVAHAIGAAWPQRQHHCMMPNTPSPRNADRGTIAGAGRRHQLGAAKAYRPRSRLRLPQGGSPPRLGSQGDSGLCHLSAP